jgi:antitoxin HicB
MWPATTGGQPACAKAALGDIVIGTSEAEVQSMEYLLPIEIESLEEGGYLATSEVLPGFLAQGRSMAETLEIAQDVARKLVESYVEHGHPLPDEPIVGAGQAERVELHIPIAAAR